MLCVFAPSRELISRQVTKAQRTRKESKAPSKPTHSKLEITRARFVAAVTVDLDRLACACARRAAILAVLCRWTRTRRISTSVLVSHNSSLKSQRSSEFETVPELNTSRLIKPNPIRLRICSHAAPFANIAANQITNQQRDNMNATAVSKETPPPLQMLQLA